MICIKCSSDTKVTNSRPHKKTPSVWRRRQCGSCGTIFTTTEVVADNSYTFGVTGPPEETKTFSLPRLMLSIARSLEYRSDDVADDAYWLAQTVAQSIQATATDAITSQALSEATWEVVSYFDATAGLNYGARHRLITNSAQKPRRGRPRTTRRIS